MMMANSNWGIKKRKAELRSEILSYKPGKDLPFDDRVEFPDNLVVGIIDNTVELGSCVDVLRASLYGNGNKLAGKRTDRGQEKHITDSIFVNMRKSSHEPSERAAQDLAGKVGCMVLLCAPYRMENSRSLIDIIKRITGKFPLCALLESGGDFTEEKKDEFKQLGITTIYEVSCTNNPASQLKWLELLHGCLKEGDRALAIDELNKICTNPRCKSRYEKAKKEAKEAKQESRSLQNEIKELASQDSLVNENRLLKKDLESKRQCIEQLERELESGIRSAEQKNKAETRQLSFIPLVTSGNKAQGGSSSEDNLTGLLERSDTLQAG